MVNNFERNRALWIVTAVLTLIAALLGVVFPDIYRKVISNDLMPAMHTQDWLTILIGAALLLIIIKTRKNDIKKQIIILGIIGAFAYLYGIFAIERVYNWAYFLYLAIFALSFWSIVYGLADIPKDLLHKVEMHSLMGKASAWVSIVIATIFNILWIVQLLPILQQANKIEFLYSIYILDLCFVMPAFIITGIMALRKQPRGFLLAPVMFIVGFFVIFPLGLAEIAKPFYNQASNIGAMLMSFTLSGLFLIMTCLHLWKLKLVN